MWLRLHWPTESEYVDLAHAVQLVDAVDAAYVPATHTVHDAAALELE
jgi:hypothetical protein